MTEYRCDICTAEIKPNEHISITACREVTDEKATIDVCPRCADAFEKWLTDRVLKERKGGK